ncbi:cyclase family protein [Candidatus Caldatribacterium sp. SIUC1]|uniref:cyclase family protein n=1 Tax=Candidatus Caldatribacterium sp. SIUC1 TaxID=3418365 RepID=UPI003F691E84
MALCDEYLLVDLSMEVVPPGTEERPFVTTRSLLHDATTKYLISTHTHVGTHLEGPLHFFEAGKDLADFPLSAFWGRAWFLDIERVPEDRLLTEAFLAHRLEGKVAPGDILIARNLDEEAVSRFNVTKDRSLLPCFTPEAALWLRDRGLKMLGIDHLVRLGKDVAATRKLHEILLSADILLLEGLANLKAVQENPFFLIAFPYKARGIDSSLTRAVALVRR